MNNVQIEMMLNKARRERIKEQRRATEEAEVIEYLRSCPDKRQEQKFLTRRQIRIVRRLEEQGIVRRIKWHRLTPTIFALNED